MVFAGVEWGWVVKGGIIYSCLLLFLRIFKKSKHPTGFADLIISIVLGVAWMVFLNLVHASPSATEVVTVILLGQAVDSLFGLIWSRRRATESP
jgi:hypothetical protein